MTPIDVMNDAADFLKKEVKEYSAKQKKGTYPISVYAGYPPIRDRAGETESFLYTLVTETEDSDGENLSTAKLEIGISVYDDDKAKGWQSLYNLMEHVRQALLKHPWLMSGKTSLILPVKGKISEMQPFPQWEGKLEAIYVIGQPGEVGINYDEF